MLGIRSIVFAAAGLCLCCLFPHHAFADDTVDELRRELETMKQQMHQMQEKMRAQERRLEELSAERAKATSPAAASTERAQGAPARARAAVAASAATAPVPSTAGAAAPASAATAGAAGPPPVPVTVVAAPAPTPAATSDDALEKRVTESILRKLQPTLAAANKTFPSQFNPAMSLAVDMVGSYKDKEKGNYEFRSAEIGLSASVDPFARAYAFFNGGNDGVSVEEASMVTTSLPWNLTLQGGRFFADFGRLSKWHDHDLPFVNRPTVLDEYVGGESQADGAQLSWLAPTEQYLNLTAGMYNKIGAENDRVNNNVGRNLSEFTYLGRASTYVNLADAHGLDAGGSFAWTPNVAVDHGAMRYLAGADVTYRYTPLQAGAYQGLVWGTEVLYNRETRPIEPTAPVEPQTSLLAAPLQDAGDPAETIYRRVGAVGLYSYLESRLTRRYTPGFLFQFVQDIDRQQGDTISYSPYFTVWLSEFQRLRAQYTYLDSPGNHESQIYLQWTVFIGAHAHGFRDR